MKDIIRFDDIDENGPQSVEGTYTFTTADVDRDEVAAVGPARAKASAEAGNAPGEYIVDGSVELTADYNCSRCLDPYPIANTSTFHIRFRPRPEASTEGEEIEIAEAEELDVEFYTAREIPLRDIALEQIQLSIPMKPLCDEKCLGLCAHCGANKNREKCSCEEPVVDERWAALHEIKESLEKKKH